jgi:hypothetical protein
VRELERTGVIRGYRAVIDPAAIGLGFEVLVQVTTDREDASTITELERRLAAIPEVRHAERLFGDPTTWSGPPPGDPSLLSSPARREACHPAWGAAAYVDDRDEANRRAQALSAEAPAERLGEGFRAVTGGM